MEGGGHHHMSVVDSVGGGDRFPQWSVQETRDFLMIRAELDPTFMETKRNKVLWELISTNMKDRGYNRSADQCKCKWKNLVTRYKGYETMEQEAGMRQQQFPFYNELQAIFTGRMQRMLWMEAEGAGSSSKKRSLLMHLSSDDEEDNEETDADKQAPNYANKKKIRKITTTNVNSYKAASNIIHPADTSSTVVNLKEILEKLMKQQMQIEMQWIKLYESKEEERRARETEWRQRMEALENEKMTFDRRWRQREEETRLKEETRSEKRDALITLLLNKLR